MARKFDERKYNVNNLKALNNLTTKEIGEKLGVTKSAVDGWMYLFGGMIPAKYNDVIEAKLKREDSMRNCNSKNETALMSATQTRTNAGEVGL